MKEKPTPQQELQQLATEKNALVQRLKAINLRMDHLTMLQPSQPPYKYLLQ